MTQIQIIYTLLGVETLLIALVAYAINASLTHVRKKVLMLEDSLETLVKAIQEMRKEEKGED
jgi:hypothetical protein